MTCNICLNPKRKTRFISGRLVLCQWCVKELIKNNDDTPKSILDSLRLNFENDERAKILPIKIRADSRPTPPIYPDAELQQASSPSLRKSACREVVLSPPIYPDVELQQAFSASLREAEYKEGVLTSIYRNLVNDQERKKEAERIKLKIEREIIERYEAKKEAYRQQLISAEKIKLRRQREIIERYEAQQEAYKQQLISIEQAKKSYSESEASLPNRIDKYINDYLDYLVTTTNQLKSKNSRLIRAYGLGLINAEKLIVNRPEEDEYERLRDLIKSQDGHACVICHKTSSNSELHVHHIIPLYKFGTNKPQNLVTLCYSCHNKQHPTFKVPRYQSINRTSRISRFIAVDIKTTGIFTQDEIIEIGAVLFENGKVINKYQSLMHSSRYVRLLPEIPKQMVDGAPKPDVAFPEFLSFISNSNLVVHNAAFVMPFLQKYAKTFGTTIPNNISDTLSISRKKLPQLAGDKIFTLTEYFSIKRTTLNSTLDDSIAIGFIFLRLSSIKDESQTHKPITPPPKSDRHINKPTLITGNETLEDAFKADSQKNYRTAFQIYWRLAKQGGAIAQFNLAVKYANGQGVKRDDEEAVYWYRGAAAQGHAGGQCNLGFMYGKGRGIKQDYTQAVFWYRKAAEQGNARGQANLGVMYQNGCGVVKDDNQAVFWYRKATEQDNADAQYRLGWMNCHGRGVKQDDKQAVLWYRKAAEQGNAEAQYLLGAMYDLGRGSKQDYKQALLWYRKSAEQGNAGGQHLLGVMYHLGQGIEQDHKQAVFWFRKAADQGAASGQYLLGYTYQLGQGVEQDDKQAVFWYRKAAEQGNAEAQCLLGAMYANGRGLAKDNKQAVFWYSKAAEQGNAEAQENLDSLEKSGLYVKQDTACTHQIEANKDVLVDEQSTSKELPGELVDLYHEAIMFGEIVEALEIYKKLCKHRYLEFQNKAKDSVSVERSGHTENRYSTVEGEPHGQIIDEYHEALAFGELEQAHTLYEMLKEHQYAEFQLRTKNNTQSGQVDIFSLLEAAKYQLPEGISHEQLVDEYHEALAFGDIEQAHLLYKDLLEHQFAEFQQYI